MDALSQFRESLAQAKAAYWSALVDELAGNESDRCAALRSDFPFSTEICMEAVARHSRALERIPPQWHNPTLYFAAVRNWPKALKFVPLEAQTPEMIFLAIAHPSAGISELSWVSPCLRSYARKLLHDGAKLSKTELNAAPEHDERFCRLAVECDSRALSQIPHEFRSQVACQLALTDSPLLMDLVPVDYVTPAFCLAVLGSKAVRKLCLSDFLKWIGMLPSECLTEAFYMYLLKFLPDFHVVIPRDLLLDSPLLRTEFMASFPEIFKKLSNNSGAKPQDIAALVDLAQVVLTREESG